MADETNVNPPSTARSEAARANGSKSHGPVTPEGKEASSKNAFKHGLFASLETLIVFEDCGWFKAHHNMLFRKYAPKDAEELYLVETIVSCTWKLMRAESIEAELYNRPKIAETQSLGNAFYRNLNELEKLEAIRAKIERRLRNARTELQKLKAANPEPSTDLELEFTQLYAPHLAEEQFDKQVDHHIKGLENGYNAIIDGWHEEIRLREAGRANDNSSNDEYDDISNAQLRELWKLKTANEASRRK